MWDYLIIIVAILCNSVNCSSGSIDNITERNFNENPCEIHQARNLESSFEDLSFFNVLKLFRNAFVYQNQNNYTINDDILEELSRSFTDSARQFFLAHDLEVKLPETVLNGSTLKVTPRSLDSNGTTLKIEVLPKDLKEYQGEGRIFFKKISKFVGDRLLFAFLAIVLVIKLLVVKFIFVLPSLVGVVAAKKLIVKVLLFVFPFLHHIFKLCAYTPYGAKHHIHKHQISHIHQVAPGHHHHPTYHKPHYVDRSPAGYHPYHNTDPGVIDDSQPSGSEYGNEVYQEPATEEPDEGLWGLNFFSPKPKKETKKPLTATEIENMVLKAEKEALIKSRLQKERERIHEENLKLQEQLNNALKMQQKLKHHAVIVSHKRKPGKYHKHKPHLATLLPPPPSPPSTYEEPPKFTDVPTDMTYVDVNGAGQFAEPPGTFSTFSNTPVVENAQNNDFQIGGVSGAFAKPGTIGNVQNEELPHGVVGGGLPASTVDAIKSYLTHKITTNNQVPHPVYSPQTQIQQQNEFFVTPLDAGFNTVIPTNQVPLQTNVINRKSDTPTQEEQFYKAAKITYDAFYSPILEKIDAILSEIKFTEEPCKERLICSMYKNPEKFSPHSNLVSNELSRDPKDLEKPKSTNAAVIRFYKYVQAARDGQDQRDCLRLYPTCAINTEA